MKYQKTNKCIWLLILITIISGFFIYKLVNNDYDYDYFISFPIYIKDSIMKLFREKIPFEAIIGIDFGSTFSGYTIIIDSINDINNENNNGIFSSEFIMFEPEKLGLYIGTDAHGFVLNENNILSDKLYFRNFKKNLNPSINSNNYVNSSTPKNKIMNLEDVITGYLQLIKKKIYKNERLKRINFKNIKWIITVPALWDIKGKELMQKAAYDAEMYNCEIILEPEASSLSIFQDKNINQKLLEQGKTFLIVDVGGYTSDLSANKIIEGKNLEQLTVPMSFVHGSNQINKEIINIVKEVLGEDKVNKLETDNYIDYLKFLDDIEKKKKEILDNSKNIVLPENVKLDISRLNITCTGKFGFSSSECEGHYKKDKIKYDSYNIYIPYTIIQKIIIELTDNILSKISYITSKIESTPNSIFLTGGFSSNVIFQNKIKKFYDGSRSKPYFLQKPQETVMKGAAIFGLYPTKIKRRIIPITVAVESINQKCLQKLNDTEGEGENNCLEYVQFFKYGNSISTEKSIKKRIFPNNEKFVNVYFTYDEILDNNNKRDLGIANLTSSNLMLSEREIFVSMTFSNYINVTITEKSINNATSVLLSYPTQEI